MNGPAPAPPRWFVPAATLLAFMGLAARVATLSGAADNDDAPLFIRGVQRFAVAEGRPHWPGYPVYIAAGKLATALVGNPALGLQLVSALAGAATSVLVAWITFRWAASLGIPADRSARAGLAGALLWLVVPVSWVTGSQILSDPLGLLCGLGILALAIAGESSGTRKSWIAAAALAGLIPGVRLVNVTMLGPLVWKAWSARRERWGGWPAGVVLAAALLAGAMPWIVGLAFTDAAGYLEAGRTHLRGHFTSFGESIWTDRQRAHRVPTAIHNVFVYGLGAGSPGQGWTRVMAGTAWIFSVAAATLRRPWRGPVFLLIASWAIPNLVYVFFAHDMTYPRYLVTADVLVVMWAGLAAADVRPSGRIVVAAAIVSVAAVTVPLAIDQGGHPPVEYQAASYLARRAPGSVVLMTKPDLLLAVYVAEFAGQIRPVVISSWDVSSWRLNGDGRGRRVYTTAIPPEDAAAWVPVAHFCRDPMIEPLIASELWLFTVGEVDADRPLPACGEER